MDILFEQLLADALQQQVSDIHFDVEGGHLRIAMRGLKGIRQLEKKYPKAILQFLKYIANLELANSNIPQNGQFTYVFQGRTLYFRLALLKSMYKESAVLRILNQYDLTLDDLSFSSDEKKEVKKWLQQKNGLILFSGPTGSGKTTTIHTILSFMANKGRKVITIEDPIEIHNRLFVQLQTNEKSGFTFESGIKEIMRHDPDIIWIGEIRDQASAILAIRAALTGHLVFSTIHAGSSSQTIARMRDLTRNESDLKEVLVAVVHQNMFKKYRKKERMVLYEILSKKNLQFYWEYGAYPKEFLTLSKKIEDALTSLKITASS